MGFLNRLPLLLVYTGLAGLFMLLPAIHAAALDLHKTARAFFYHGIMILIITGLLGLAIANRPVVSPIRSHLRAYVLAYLLLPPLFALPFWQAVGDTSFLNAWWEMVSSFTTTGATLYTPSRLEGPMHLWRGLVGWLGGFNVLMATASILASRNLGGFELWATRAFGRTRPDQASRVYDHGQRLWDHARTLAPLYIGVTVGAWAILHAMGDSELTSLMHAMAVISTSGISPVGGLHGASSGPAGEIVLALVLLLALSRRLTPGAAFIETNLPLWRDPELRVAGILILGSSVILLGRHFLLSTGTTPEGIGEVLHLLWAGFFTALSFLTTTGFASEGWGNSQSWGSMTAPWLILLGLAMIGGGVATATGGVKLLRVYALYLLCRRELDRLSEPSSVGGGGPAARHLRGEGAIYAFVFFMLFALTLGVMNLILTALDLPLETAVILSASAITTTGPMPSILKVAELDWAGLGAQAKIALAGGMILGRLETLVVIAFLLPTAWRR